MPLAAQSMTNAINAYTNAAKAPVSGLGAGDAGQGDTFGNLVKSAIEKAVEINKQGESLSIAAVSDRADLNQVVTAVAEAELTLQTMVSVRDKVIDAYNQIIRMPM